MTTIDQVRAGTILYRYHNDGEKIELCRILEIRSWYNDSQGISGYDMNVSGEDFSHTILGTAGCNEFLKDWQVVK